MHVSGSQRLSVARRATVPLTNSDFQCPSLDGSHVWRRCRRVGGDTHLDSIESTALEKGCTQAFCTIWQSRTSEVFQVEDLRLDCKTVHAAASSAPTAQINYPLSSEQT